MSYDKPYRTRHVFDLLAASTDATVTTQYAIMAPRGKSGRPYDYGIEGVTTTLSSGASVAIGTTADVDAYGEEFDISAADSAKSLRGTYWPLSASTAESVLADFIVGESTAVQGSTGKVWVTVVGSSAGAGTVFVEMEWND